MCICVCVLLLILSFCTFLYLNPNFKISYFSQNQTFINFPQIPPIAPLDLVTSALNSTEPAFSVQKLQHYVLYIVIYIYILYFTTLYIYIYITLYERKQYIQNAVEKYNERKRRIHAATHSEKPGKQTRTTGKIDAPLYIPGKPGMPGTPGIAGV